MFRWLLQSSNPLRNLHGVPTSSHMVQAEQGVALVIVMPAVPKVERRRYVTKRDLVKYGYTGECQACTQLALGMHNEKVPDDRCRDSSGELMASDDDQRQVERVSSRTAVGVGNEIPCLEGGEEVDATSDRSSWRRLSICLQAL